jgi:hypothetical protein
MKSVFFHSIILLLIFTTSCSKKSEKEIQSKIEVEKVEPRTFDYVLNEIFYEKYPNFLTNSIAKDLALDKVLFKFDSLKEDGIISDIPLKLWYVKKNPYGPGAFAHFYTFEIKPSGKRISEKMNFDIVGFVGLEEASKLKEGDYYYIFGKNFNRTDKIGSEIISDKVFYQREPEIIASENSFHQLNLGLILFEADSLVKIKR